MSNNTASSTARVGRMAPDFELPDINMNMHKLSDYRGKTLVIAFFPAAESPVCTSEMCSFRDSQKELMELDAKIIGISVDGPFANKAFSRNRQLTFPLLSDYKRETINRYGIVMNNLSNLKDYDAAKRSIFIVDPNGKIQYEWVSDNPLVQPNYEEIKSSLEKKK
jgi:glutaredoxin-dependent peroxiredoxin